VGDRLLLVEVAHPHFFLEQQQQQQQELSFFLLLTLTDVQALHRIHVLVALQVASYAGIKQKQAQEVLRPSTLDGRGCLLCV
jgi:hypothetical protein